MRWIVVGAGSIGRRHLRNLAARGERDLVAVRRAGDALGPELPGVRIAASVAEAAGDAAGAAIVCTPTSLHVDGALEALRAGCHVLVEKPLADGLARYDELQDAARAAGTVVGVAHCFRFHALLRGVRDALAAGRIGRPLAAAVWCGQHLADWRPGRDHRETYSARRSEGGGVLLDLVHELDYADWLLGPIRAVSAEVRHSGTLGIDAEDTADLILGFESGATASCHLDYLARPPVRGGWILGDRGSIRWDLIGGTGERSDGMRSEPLAVPGGWEREDMYRDELAVFADAIAGRGEFPVGLEAGARAVRIALAARESSATGRRIAL